MAVNAGASLLGVAMVLTVLVPSPVQGSRSLLQSGASLVLSTPIFPPGTFIGLGFGPSASVGVGSQTTFVFLIDNQGNAPASTATVSLTINDLFTFSKPYAANPQFKFTISPDGHSISADYGAPVGPGKQINFQVDVTATAAGPQALPFGLTGSAVPGGAPYRSVTPAVTPNSQGVCGTPGPAADFPTRCYFNADINGHYVCCDAQGCNGFNADNYTPNCKNSGYVPPGQASRAPPTQSSPPTGDQGVCGTGPAQAFPTRCWYNSDPQGRYVCCNGPCNGFLEDRFTPKCALLGYIPDLGSPNPNPPSGPPASGPPSGDQGVCGTGPAQYFPNRCWYNNDPQGRYVCCDSDGCDGFNSDNLTPHCKKAGFVPS